MSLLVTLDPAVLEAAATYPEESLIINMLSGDREVRFALACDSEGYIREAYAKVTDFKVPIHQAFTKRYLINIYYPPRLIELSGVQEWIHDKRSWLISQGIMDDFERIMISTEALASDPSTLLIVGEDTGKMPRKINSQLVKNQYIRDFLPARVHETAQFHDYVNFLPKVSYPSTQQHLRDFLSQPQNHSEHQWMEWKQPAQSVRTPRIDSTKLSISIIRDACLGVCGMLNAAQIGDVFVGINPSRAIVGIEPVYNGLPRTNDDLCQLFYNELRFIEPLLGCNIFVSLIDLDNGLKVIHIRVDSTDKDPSTNYLYDDYTGLWRILRVATSNNRTRMGNSRR